eukprot:Opistho-1_new@56791
MGVAVASAGGGCVGRGRLRRRVVWILALLAVAYGTRADNVDPAVKGATEERSFGVEMEFAGLGETMRVGHINNIPAENYEAVLGLIASEVFGDYMPAINHEVIPVPHPLHPEKYEPRKVRTSTWVDPKGRTWKVTSEYVTLTGVYDGYEVVFPPLTDPNEAEQVAQALWSSGLLTKGEKSAMHVHVNASCLVQGPGAVPESPALGLANLLVLHEQLDPIIRRLFHTRHFGGSMNPFSRALSDVHQGLIEQVARAGALHGTTPVTVGAIKAIFENFADAEFDFVGVSIDDADSGASADRFNTLRRVWKYHSLNVANLIPLNQGFTGQKTTVEFRAFDLLEPEEVRLAVTFCRALVEKACSDAADSIAIVTKGMLPQAPLGGEAAVDLVPKDPEVVKLGAVELLRSLGLNPDDFAVLLNAIREEDAEDWAEPMVGAPSQRVVRDRVVARKRRATTEVEDELTSEQAAELQRNLFSNEIRKSIKSSKNRESEWDIFGLDFPASEFVDDSTYDDDTIRRLTLGAFGSCRPNPCKNGGTCVGEDKGFFCECPDPYFGDLCQYSPFTSTQTATNTPTATNTITATRTITPIYTSYVSESLTPTPEPTHTLTMTTSVHPTITPHPHSSHKPSPHPSSVPHSSARHSSSHAPLHSSSEPVRHSSPVPSPSSGVEPEPSSEAPEVSSSEVPPVPPTSTPLPPSEQHASSKASPAPSEVHATTEPIRSSEASSPVATSAPSKSATPTGSSQPRSTTALSASAKKNAIKVTFANLDQQTFQTQYESGFKNAIAKAVNKALGNGRRRAVVVGSDDVVIIQYAPSGTSLGVIFYVGVMGADGQEVVISADVLLAAVQASLAEIAAALGLTILSVGLSPNDDGGGGGGGIVVPSGSSGGGGSAIGPAIGGAVGGIAVIGGIVGFVIYRKKKSGSYNVQRVRIEGDVEAGKVHPEEPAASGAGTVVHTEGTDVFVRPGEDAIEPPIGGAAVPGSMAAPASLAMASGTAPIARHSSFAGEDIRRNSNGSVRNAQVADVFIDAPDNAAARRDTEPAPHPMHDSGMANGSDTTVDM